MVLQSLSLKSPRLLPILILLVVLAIAVVQVLPNYTSGAWSWNRPPQLTTIKQLRTLTTEGLSLPPDWVSSQQQDVRISGHPWSVQDAVPTDPQLASQLRSPAWVMIRPPTSQDDQPQVEWTDINGFQQWTADKWQHLTFSVAAGSSRYDVKARFFRGWNREKTYAVVQWYAWADGGDPSPSRWFWADVATQLRQQQRMPWVAVSLLIPIKPLGTIESARPMAESLAQAVQASLMQAALNLSP